MGKPKMTTIILRQAWQLGNQLAAGGFGCVHECKAQDESTAVVKLIPKAPGASRELLFEELSGLCNIIPILDRGEWENYYVLVMPRAEESLRQHLEKAGGQLTLDEAVAVLTDVAEALASLEGDVVHRDIKPENVLLYENHWCLADFGIARYAEATTAPDTRKFAMTPSYAAPERWRGERATNATDVYAFGVMAFELLYGALPFPGPDLREQHLNQPPPVVSGYPPTIVSLVNECLFKASASRPTPANIFARLRACQTTASSATARLQAVNKAVVEKQGERYAEISAERSREECRREIFGAAQQSFTRILEVMKGRVLEAAPATNVSTGHGLTLCLGDGTLTVDPVQMAPAECLAVSGYGPAFDVIAYTAIAVRRPQDPNSYEGRQHSLWFCDAHDEGVYRWYELAFMVSPLIPERFTLDPFGLPPTGEHAAGALSPAMHVRQIAWQPLPFDQGDEEQFIDRWLTWFAAAVDGTISHPSSMPEKSGGRFRQPHLRERRRAE